MNIARRAWRVARAPPHTSSVAQGCTLRVSSAARTRTSTAASATTGTSRSKTLMTPTVSVHVLYSPEGSTACVPASLLTQRCGEPGTIMAPRQLNEGNLMFQDRLCAAPFPSVASPSASAASSSSSIHSTPRHNLISRDISDRSC